MASLKIASLLLRTLSKPIATKIKQRAKDHEGFKSRTIGMAQFLHRAEMNLRVSLLGESPKHIRPLSESRAIESGANFLSEGFLFAVAATIILGETYRSRLSESKRRDQVKDSLIKNELELTNLKSQLKSIELERRDEIKKFNELGGIVEQVVIIGLKGGFYNNNNNPNGGERDIEIEESKTAWERHLRIAELARRFGTNGRVLKDDDDDDHHDEGIDENDSSTTALFLRTDGELARRGTVVDSRRNEVEGGAELRDEGPEEVEREPRVEPKKDTKQEKS
ncbi:hypothetical protein JCM3765_002839 [Sporobolomyces pararoseus]